VDIATIFAPDGDTWGIAYNPFWIIIQKDGRVSLKKE
jgi:hypothetical protein